MARTATSKNTPPCSCATGNVVGNRVVCRHGNDLGEGHAYGSLPEDRRAIKRAGRRK